MNPSLSTPSQQQGSDSEREKASEILPQEKTDEVSKIPPIPANNPSTSDRQITSEPSSTSSKTPRSILYEREKASEILSQDKTDEASEIIPIPANNQSTSDQQITSEPSSSSNIPRNEEPLQIIHIVSSENENGDILHELELNEENLSRIMLRPDVKDNIVMIVSIAGALRMGKSFLLGFILKYLEAEMGGDWLNEDDTIEGFEWRNGTDVVTHGILIWSRPFIVKNRSNEQVAILLMDTQGIFDSTSTRQECANIFTLSGLISSVQIFNLLHQIQEDNLENLEYFSEFGKLIQEKSDIKDASQLRLIFLIRDWGCPNKFQYGEVGGEAYVKEKLQVDCKQPPQLKRIRDNLNGGFLEFGGFLLPYPGKVVATSDRFAVKDIDQDFLEFVKIFVPYVIPENNLKPKQMNGRDLKGKDMLVYIKSYVKLLREGDYEKLETAVEATAAVYRNSASNEAYELYEDEMETLFMRNFETLDDLEKYHTLTRKKSFSTFTDSPRLRVAEKEELSLIKLAEKIEEKYQSFKERAQDLAKEDRESALQKAYKLYKDEMKKLFVMRNFETLDDLEKYHTFTKEKSFSTFTDSPRIRVAEKEELSLIKLEEKIEEKYQSFKERAQHRAAEDRESALQQAYRLYKDEMEKCFKMWNFESLENLKEHHLVTKKQSLSKFTDSPRLKIAEQENLSLKELKEKIEDKYHLYEKSAHDKADEDRKSALQQAYKLYKDEMEQSFQMRLFLSLDAMKEHHILVKEQSLRKFTDNLRIKVVELDGLSRNKLKEKIEEKYKSYEKRALDKAAEDRRSALQKAYTLYEDEMEMLFEMGIFVTLEILKEHHRLKKEQSIREFKNSHRIKVVEDETLSLNDLEERVEEKCNFYENKAQAKAEAVRKLAFGKANKEYEEDMKEFLETTMLITFGNLKTQHIRSKENSLNEYNNCPRFNIAEEEEKELSPMELERKIEEKYCSYQEKTIQRKIKYAVASTATIAIVGMFAGSHPPSRLILGAAFFGYSLYNGLQNHQNRT